MAIELNKLNDEDKSNIVELVKMLEYHGLKVDLKGSDREDEKYSMVRVLASGSVFGKSDALAEFNHCGEYGAFRRTFSVTVGQTAIQNLAEYNLEFSYETTDGHVSLDTFYARNRHNVVAYLDDLVRVWPWTPIVALFRTGSSYSSSGASGAGINGEGNQQVGGPVLGPIPKHDKKIDGNRQIGGPTIGC